MKFYQFMVFLFFFIFLFCFYGNRIYTKMTVPYVVNKTMINKEDTDMVIPSEKYVEHFEGKDDRSTTNKDFPVPIDKDDKKELLEKALYSNTMPDFQTKNFLHLTPDPDKIKFEEQDKIYINPFHPKESEHVFKPKKNYQSPEKMTTVERNAYKFGYPDGMTMQDYVDWLFLFKDNPELLNLEHYINYEKLINNVEIKYEKDRTPPPSKKLTPLNSENYFTQMYSEPPTMVQSDLRRVEGEVRVSTNQGSITNGLLPYNFEKYGDFKHNFDVLGQSGKIYNEKMADKTDPYFLGAMVGPNWNVSKKNLG
jgi:hypothetical protein